MTRQRVGAALTAAAMVYALLSACLFLSLHAGHSCHGGRCPVCLGLQVCAEQLQTVRMAGSASAFRAPTSAIRREASRAPVPAQSFQTLVTWKVKLSD